MKSLKEISWQVTEPEYREDKAFSYSTLAKFAREGFHGLPKLFDKVESPSLTFGSAVDALITGGQQEFDSNFFVAEFPSITDSIKNIVEVLFREFAGTHRTLQEIPDVEIIGRTEVFKYQPNWKPETRAKVIREQGSEYYNLMYISNGRKIINTELKSQIDNAVEALRTSDATKWYFQEDNPWDGIERFYQLKFKTTLNGINYRCMADLLIVDHNSKFIYPVDLKTSSHYEDEFFESFVQWSYHIQARLYWRIIRKCMDESEEYADYKLADYSFIVVNKESLKPLVWGFEETKYLGTLRFGRDKHIEFRDPEDIAKELKYYIENEPRFPIGIKGDEGSINDITHFLNMK